MGSLSLPASGAIYVDTQVIIYSVERHPVYLPLVQPIWQAARAGSLAVLTSDLTLLECLVLPLRLGDQGLQRAYEQALLGTELRLIPISQAILRKAAMLRAANTSLRTPDAIHAASAAASGCALLVTNDMGLRTVAGVQVTVLNDFVRP